MNQTDSALKEVMAAISELPPRLQRQLAERLVETTAPGENTTVIYLKRLSPRKQSRLAELLDKSNEGRISRKERSELGELGLEVDRILLANSQALARALRPELFDEQGRPIKSRFSQASKETSLNLSESKRGTTRR